jgi:hypothetical protein
MNKNKKISKSLKRHYKRQKSYQDVKAVIGFIVIVATVGILIELFSPIALANDYMNYARLPENKDKENLTDWDRVFIESAKACNEKGLDQNCVNDLMGITWNESRYDCSAKGDFGASYGCQQIHMGYHEDITPEQAQAKDPSFSVLWTLNRLVHYGYPEYRSYAIMKHNGTPNTATTLKYLEDINSYISL